MSEGILLQTDDDVTYELELERVNDNGAQVVLRFVDPKRRLAWVVPLQVTRVERV